jgi:hypothetical protein
MPIKISVTAPPAVYDPYAAFKTEYQRQLLELFKAGATLFVWRCSSPHNWYLETADGTQYMVSGDRESCEACGTGSNQQAALKRLASHTFASKTVVTRGNRFENGLPEQEGWTFDAALARAAEESWFAFEIEQATRAAALKAPAPQLDQLTDQALSLLRSLKSSYSFPRYPELAGAFAELDAQGLIELHPTGQFRLVSAMAKLRVPRGLALQPA